MNKPPPRLHIIFASEKNYAVIIRRGPSKFASTFGWNLETNEVTLGQWFKGRINGRKSSLSPNGEYLLYSAMDCRWSSITTGVWTAISRAPYIRAIELYSDIEERGGGGLFTSNTDYHLNEIFFNEDKFIFRANIFNCLNTPDEHCLYGSVGVYVSRLKALGWRHEKTTQFEKYHSSISYVKMLPNKMLLKKHLLSKYPAKITEWEEHEIFAEGKLIYSTSSWECGDFISDKIYFTENGVLKALHIANETAVGHEAVIHDFNGYQIEPLVAPYDD